MTCREIVVAGEMVERHVTSHGTTCCVCGREFPERFLLIEVRGGAKWSRLGACSEGCAVILGRWQYLRGDRECCLAHSCIQVTLDGRPM